MDVPTTIDGQLTQVHTIVAQLVDSMQRETDPYLLMVMQKAINSGVTLHRQLKEVRDLANQRRRSLDRLGEKISEELKGKVTGYVKPGESFHQNVSMRIVQLIKSWLDGE